MSLSFEKIPNEMEILMEPRKKRSTTVAKELHAMKQTLNKRNPACRCGRPQLQMQKTQDGPPPHAFQRSAELAKNAASSHTANMRKLYAKRADGIILDRDMLTKSEHINFLATPKKTSVAASSSTANSSSIFGNTGSRLKGGSGMNNGLAFNGNKGANLKRSSGAIGGKNPRNSNSNSSTRTFREKEKKPATTMARLPKTSKQPVSILKNSTSRYECPAPPGYVCSGGVCTRVNTGAGSYGQCAGGSCSMNGYRNGVPCSSGNCAGGSCSLPAAPRHAYNGSQYQHYSGSMPSSQYPMGQQRPY